MMLVVRNTCIRKEDIRARYDLEQANRKMMYLSNKDPLTGAWNRRFLKNAFDGFAAKHHDTDRPYHFAFVDIDDFKPINDNCGHEYGDAVLRAVARAFGEAVGDDGYFVRMGGDEFAVLFGADDPQALLAEAWQQVNVAMPPQKSCAVLPLGLSIGLLSVPPGCVLSLVEVSREADTALYQAKDRKEDFRDAANIIAKQVNPAAGEHESVA